MGGANGIGVWLRFQPIGDPIDGSSWVLGATASQMGLLTAAEFAPNLALGLVAGVWVDRLRRRQLLVAADLGRAALLTTIPVAYLLGILTIAQLMVVAFCAGALTILFLAADGAYLPSLVGRARLVEANSAMTVGRSVAGAVGPSAAGALVQAVTAPLAILVDVVSFLVSATLVGRVRLDEPVPERSTGAAVWTSAAEGLRFALGNPFLRAITITAALSNLGANVVAAVYILYATRELGITPVGLGLVATALSVGTVLGAIVAGRVTARFGLGPTFLGAAALIVLGAAATPAAGLMPGAALAMLITGQAVVGLTLPLFNVNISSIRQGVTPDRLLGRTSSGITFFTGGAMPVGALLGGALGDSAGLWPTLVVGVALIAVGALALVVSPIRMMRELPETVAT